MAEVGLDRLGPVDVARPRPPRRALRASAPLTAAIVWVARRCSSSATTAATTVRAVARAVSGSSLASSRIVATSCTSGWTAASISGSSSSRCSCNRSIASRWITCTTGVGKNLRMSPSQRATPGWRRRARLDAARCGSPGRCRRPLRAQRRSAGPPRRGGPRCRPRRRRGPAATAATAPPPQPPPSLACSWHRMRQDPSLSVPRAQQLTVGRGPRQRGPRSGVRGSGVRGSGVRGSGRVGHRTPSRVRTVAAAAAARPGSRSQPNGAAARPSPRPATSSPIR